MSYCLTLRRELKSAVQPEMPVLTGQEGENKPPAHVTISGMFGGCGYRFVTNDAECYLKVVASSRMDHNFKRVWHVDENGYTRVAIEPK